MKINNTPYTYLLGWSKLNRWYYGVRYAEECNPSDLWVKYKTSSNYVKEIYEQYGDPDHIEVRRIFTDVSKAQKWESKVLTRLQAAQRDKWINMNNSDGKFYCNGPYSKEHRQNISKALKGKPASEDQKRKQRIAMTGRTHSKESRRKMSESRMGENNHNYGKHHSDETKQKISKAHKGRVISDEWRKKMSESHKKVKKKECVYCKKMLDPGNYAKHHGDKCKLKSMSTRGNIANG